MVDYYPPWGFYFHVKFSISDDRNDTRFQSVSGLSAEFDTEEYKEGGENKFVHKLPVRAKYSELVLKRGMLTDSRIIKWFLDSFANLTITPCNIVISLMNEKNEILRSWNIVNAWPVKWSVSDLNSVENSVVIETMTLNYRYFSIIEG